MPAIKYIVRLTAEERSKLEHLATQGPHDSQKILNALILLACDDGPNQDRKLTGEEIVGVLPVSRKKIERVKRRFLDFGLDAALEKRKPQRNGNGKADGAFESRLVALSSGAPPVGHQHWSLRLLAERMIELQYVDSISHETIRRVLNKMKHRLRVRINW